MLVELTLRAHEAQSDGHADAALLMTLPPPMHAANRLERRARACYSWGSMAGTNFMHYRLDGPPRYTRISGWNQTMEVRRSKLNASRPNPGLTANESGAVVEMLLDTAPQNAPRQANTAQAQGQTSERVHDQHHAATRRLPLIQLLYLESYEHMGRVRVECASGCRCPGVTIDAHHAVNSMSLFEPLRSVTLGGGGDGNVSLRATRCIPVSPSSSCRLSLTILSETSSGEHKFLLHELHVVEVEMKASMPRGAAWLAGTAAAGPCERFNSVS